MRVVTIILIVVALAFAGATAFFVNQFLHRTAVEAQKPPKVIEEPKVEVLVAAADLKVGKILRSEDLRWQLWPKDTVNPDYVVRSTDAQGKADSQKELADITGSAVRVAIKAGEPILSSKLFHRGEAGFLAGVLAPGMRAVTVSVNAETGTGGFVQPGDHVDLIVNFNVVGTDPQTGKQRNDIVSETVLQNLRVLAVDQTVAPGGSGNAKAKGNETVATVAKTVTLEVTPNQAQAVSVADQLGRIRLVLRSAVNGKLAETPRRYSPDYTVSKFLGNRFPKSARILVAAHDIPAGTVMTDRDWVWKSFPMADVKQTWVPEGGDINALRSALTETKIPAGQPIIPDNLVLPGADDYITDLLKPGMRAVTIALDEVRSVSGFVAPGDRVDVIFNYAANIKYNDSALKPFFIKQPRRFSQVLLENVRVLGIDRVFDPKTGLPALDPKLPTATLEVTPKQAEEVILATNEGTLSLVLRGLHPGTGSRLNDYTSDFSINRSLVDLIYGLTMPPPPPGVSSKFLPSGVQPQSQSSSNLKTDKSLDIGKYLSGPATPPAGSTGRTEGEVRVYRSTVPQDLNFSQ